MLHNEDETRGLCQVLILAILQRACIAVRAIGGGPSRIDGLPWAVGPRDSAAEAVKALTDRRRKHGA